VPVTVSYDATSGTISASVGGGPVSPNTAYGSTPSNGFFTMEFNLSGPHIGQSDNGYITADTAQNPGDTTATLTDNGASGQLQPTITESADGQTLTTSWSSPLLEHLDLNYVTINNMYADPFYLNGNGPHATLKISPNRLLTAAEPYGRQTAAAVLDARLINTSAADNASEYGDAPTEDYFPDLTPQPSRRPGCRPGCESHPPPAGTPASSAARPNPVVTTLHSPPPPTTGSMAHRPIARRRPSTGS
jgi:hypothetical protein